MHLQESFKVAVYLPPETLEPLIQALSAIPVNTMGAYSNAMSWWPIRSTWTSMKGSDPYNGTPGQRTDADEYRLEFLCHEDDIEKALDCILRVHPYEHPAIDIIRVQIPDLAHRKRPR